TVAAPSAVWISEDEGAVAVAPAHTRLRVGGAYEPAAVVAGAEQRREAGRTVEARPAQPVERAVAPDEGGGLAVSDEGVVLDRAGHRARAALRPFPTK